MRIRAASFLLIVCYLLGLLTLPAAPTLVCDMTGLPMAAPVRPKIVVAATPSAHPCCAARLSSPAQRATETIERVACCHLTQAKSPRQSPALLRLPFSFLAIVTEPIALPPPQTVAVQVALPPLRRAAPRAPPSRRLPARAPPVFS